MEGISKMEDSLYNGMEKGEGVAVHVRRAVWQIMQKLGFIHTCMCVCACMYIFIHIYGCIHI